MAQEMDTMLKGNQMSDDAAIAGTQIAAGDFVLETYADAAAADADTAAVAVPGNLAYQIDIDRIICADGTAWNDYDNLKVYANATAADADTVAVAVAGTVAYQTDIKRLIWTNGTAWIDSTYLKVYANATAADADTVAVAVAGTVAYQTDIKRLIVTNGTAWIDGDYLKAYANAAAAIADTVPLAVAGAVGYLVDEKQVIRSNGTNWYRDTYKHNIQIPIGVDVQVPINQSAVIFALVPAPVAGTIVSVDAAAQLVTDTCTIAIQNQDLAGGAGDICSAFPVVTNALQGTVTPGTLHGTAANLVVVKDDLFEVKITTNGSGLIDDLFINIVVEAELTDTVLV